MGKRKYYWQWLSIAFCHAIGWGDGVAFLIGISIPIARQFVPDWEAVMNELAWQIPLGVFSAFILVRLLLAPYWIYKDKCEELAKISKEKSNLEAQLKEKGYKNFSVAWVNGEWWLHTPTGNNQYWEDESDGLSLLLRGNVSVTTIGTIQVESVTLDMGGQSYVCNWESEGFYTSEERDVEFEIPLSTPRGERSAILKAIVDGQLYTSKSFMLDLPKGKQEFRREDSKN